MTKFKIETFNDYLKNTISDIEKGEIVNYAISTMNLFARPGSSIEKFLDALLQRGFKVYYDKTLTERVYVLPDGHYVFKILPRGKKKTSQKDISDKVTAKIQRKYADILVDLEPRFFQIELGSSLWKKLRSAHLLQFLGTSHLKVAPAVDRDGARTVTITTGELSSESNQNNLALIFQTDKGYDFVVQKLLNTEYRVGKKLYETCQLTKKMSLVADYGNHGAPREIPQIHKLAEDLIGDQPKSVLLVSQYNPSGRILRALNCVARAGARVVIPLEPKNDYRRNDAGFKLLFGKFLLKVSRKIHLPERPKPSHIKCLIVKHADYSLSMIFGSDNFESWADVFYRNTEVALVVSRVKKGEDGFEMIQEMLDKLVETKEITADVRAVL